MKWRRFTTKPRIDDLRKTRKFAFLPTHARDIPPPGIDVSGSTWTIWLETYEFVEKADYYGRWVFWYRRVLFPQRGE